MKKSTKIIFVIILAAINIIYSFVEKEQAVFDESIAKTEYQNVGQIYNNTKIEQSFVCNKNGLNKIEIMFGNYDRINDSVLDYVIKDEKNTEIAKGTIDASELGNYEFSTISFNQIKDSAGKKYIIEISDKGAAEGQGVTILTTPSGKYEKVIINGKASNESLSDATIVMNIVTKGFDIGTFVIVCCYELFIWAFVRLLYIFLK